MGLFDKLFSKSKCPMCGSQGARVSNGRVRCPNPGCSFYDAALAAPKSRSWGQANFSLAQPLSIRYRNHRGEERIFTADRQSIARKRNHIVARVTPTGRKIALSRDRIQNLSEVEQAVPQIASQARTGPSARERQVLSYHKKHRSTSPLYERIRAKYPDW
jgi:hypothetical protein